MSLARGKGGDHPVSVGVLCRTRVPRHWDPGRHRLVPQRQDDEVGSLKKVEGVGGQGGGQ